MAGYRHNRTKGGRSVFQTILLPSLALLAVEALLLVGSLGVSNVVRQLDQNARDILNQRVENRQNYLESSMVGSWSDLTLLAEEINTTAQNMLEEGTISLEELDSSSDACAPLLLDVMEDMISTLYAKRVSGIFVIFDTHGLTDFQGESGCPSKTGVYIRDMDPDSPPSSRKADLLLERAPIAVVQAMGISTDSGWTPMFSFDSQMESGYYDYFFRPYQSALQAESVEAPSDYGYWSANPFALQGSTHTAIAYSIPLVLPDGTVYGVLGIDLLTDYLQTALPYAELAEDKQGSYLVAVSGEEGYTVNLVSGPVRQYLEPGDVLELSPDEEGGARLTLGGRGYYAYAAPFVLYNTNTPFEGQQWIMVGMTPEDDLYAFSRLVRTYLGIAILCTLLTGVLGSLIIGRRVSRPIHTLSKEVERAQREQGGLPQLSRTGITEIDQFSQAFTALSQEVVDSSTKFLRIMEMASVEIGGYELRQGEDRVFVTDNFFSLFGRAGVDTKGLTVQGFLAQMEEIRSTTVHTEMEAGDILFQIPLPQGDIRYLRVESREDGISHVGLAEDVTAATKERLRIERERDYDLLTGLCSRRAFYRQAGDLFHTPERLGHAALVMLDLDNLKNTNDRFGHDWGDQYIRQAGQCFAAGVPAGTLCARVSGDEFNLLFYGYENREEIRRALDSLGEAIRSSSFDLPNGERVQISASGGVAWYPEDSTDLKELMRYADFSMYQVKQSQKGRLGEFDLGIYNREYYLNQAHKEFRRLLEEELVSYHFQPLVDAGTGVPAAYEALMRVDLPALNSPIEVLNIARAEGKLQDIERLTWFKATQAYQSLLDRGLVEPEALLFINSIASQRLSDADREELCRRCSNLQGRVVIEITEAEEMDEEATRVKREIPGFSGLFALDDYGSGYNSEKNLLLLSPKFIKVDISIIRDIDTDSDKQQIVSNIVRYAHERDMRIVAEGLETAQETWKALELGVDLLQGYYLARPGAIPNQVSPAAAELIRRFWKEHSGPL